MGMNKVGLLAIAALFCAGCTGVGGRNVIDAVGVTSEGQPSNIAVMSNDGLQTGSYQGGLPTNIKQDSEGAWVTTPGQGGAVILNMGKTSAYIWSPQDGSLEKLTLKDPDGTVVLEVEGLTFNVSAHAAVLAGMFGDAIAGLQGMTQEQAAVRIEEAKQLGEIPGVVADALVRYFVPTLPIE